MPSIARQMSVCGLLSCALLGAASVHAAPTLLGFYTFENTNGSFANVTDVSGNNKNR